MENLQELKKEAQELDWVDHEIDLMKALEIIREQHPNGDMTLLSDLKKESETSNYQYEVDPAITNIMQYCMDKYGKHEGLLVNTRIIKELFFSIL